MYPDESVYFPFRDTSLIFPSISQDPLLISLPRSIINPSPFSHFCACSFSSLCFILFYSPFSFPLSCSVRLSHSRILHFLHIAALHQCRAARVAVVGPAPQAAGPHPGGCVGECTVSSGCVRSRCVWVCV